MGVGVNVAIRALEKNTLQGRTTGDLKEFWHFGQDLDAHPESARNYTRNNIQVKELQNFNKVGKSEVYKKARENS